MPIGQLITLGIGTPSSIPLLDLTGLMPSVISPSQTTGSIVPGLETTLIANVIYALPPRVINIEWLSTGAAAIEGSIDQTNWITLGSQASAGQATITGVTSLFVRATQTVTVVVRKKKGKL